MVVHSIGLGEKGPRRRLSAIALQEQPQYQTGPPPSGKVGIKQAKLIRSRSLPTFGSKYFDELREEGNRDSKVRKGYACRTSIDFDIIQRCQRPQYATQLHLYHQYRQWRNPNHDDRKLMTQKTTSRKPLSKRMSSVRALGSSIRGTFQHLDPVRRGSNSHRLSLTGRFQLPSEHVETIDPQSKAFIKRIKELGRVWSIVMLVIAIYNLVITPFKLCFATDLTELHEGSLRVWSGFEIFMDILCVFDVGYKIRYASLTLHSVGSSLTSKHHGGCRWIFVSNPALRADILAMLPLELLLFATDIRIPLAYPPHGDAAHASWWATRWLLRMNRLLLVQRIEPLSEELFQFMIYDRKVPADEAFLYFLKGLTSYLTMGHLLACLWFVTSEAAFHHYGTSWLSTSGMLTFIGDESSEIEHTSRMLSESATSFYLESVSLTHKYLRSLLFSMECISTLFYGDIVSMNPVELIVEIAITLWSIYIYGALVGAQGELLNARARREAAFEQSLGEMQRYLVQNDVPKKLKRQIKSYYARVWRRRKGEKEFAAVAHVSHNLHEDVVLATLREFAARVTAFRSLDDHFLRGLLVCLHYVVCSEGEEVAVKGDVDRSMYFIAQGRVLVKLDSGESIRERGEFFGELALLYGVSRLETCVALVLTELYRLDHQPYERLLQDFPEYRERNKVAWTSPDTAAPDRDMLEEMMLSYERGQKRSKNPPMTIPALNTDDVVANAERINADLPYSHIYKFIMELLAQLQRVDPLEARDLVIQGRAGARKHLKALLGLATSRDEILHKEEPTAPPTPAVELVSPFQSRGDEEPNDRHDDTPPDEMWQDPFVEVIKFGMTHRNVGWYTQGDVEQIQDQHIHKNVFKIRGAIAATNYLRVPRDADKGTHGLGLTGRYAYLQVRRIGDLPMTIHLDFVTNKKTTLRFTLSSLYELFRSTGTVLRVPLSLDAQWTVVVVDMVRLLELHSFNQYARDFYRHLKTVTLCASMNVRNVFVSPTLYTPTSLPSVLRFPGGFGEQYRWITVPPEENVSFDSSFHRLKQEDLRIAAMPTPARSSRRNSMESIPSVHYETKREEVASTHEVEVEFFTKVSPRTRDSNIRRDRNEILSKADQILRDAGVFDFSMDSANNQTSTDTAYQSPLSSPMARFSAGMKQGLRTRIVASSTKAEWPDPILELGRVIGFSNDFPRMLVWVPNGSACIYTSSSTIIFREFCDVNNDPVRLNASRTNGKGINLSTEAVKGSVESTSSHISTQEHFLYGHCSAISALAVTSDGGLLASAELPTQTTQNGVRLWDLSSRECITVIKAQPKGVHALCFSAPLKRRILLCVVGRDECFRTQIFVWDCSSLRHDNEEALSGTAISLMARQTSDFPIDRIAFSPYVEQDQFHLVSCGRENIRYWRINPNTSHLTGCPVILNEYSRGTVFTDIGFDTIAETHPSNIHRTRPLYVTSNLGTLLVIDYFSKEVICVYQLHDAGINCLSINEGFCVTGSDDCFLRVWPLDFTDFFLEAHHEAGVSMVDVSADGMKVLVGSRNNAIGVLDISSQQYATLLRSHTKEITAMASAPWGCPLSSLLLEDARSGGIGTGESELVTASKDGTLRVWDTSSGHQLFEFDIQQERVTSLAASPANSGIVAVGFISGSTRIFDVHRTSTTADNISGGSTANEAPSNILHEFRQHQSSIRHIAFDSNAQHLFTSGGGKQLCLYDARQQDYLPLKMLLADFDSEDGRFEVSHDNKWLAVVSGDRQDIIMLDPCSLRAVATVRPPTHGQGELLKLARFSNHSTELLVLSASDRLHIFTLPHREFVQSMPLLGQDGISSLVMSANAKYMATGGVDGSLRVWNWDDRGRLGRMHQSRGERSMYLAVPRRFITAIPTGKERTHRKH
ncbi:hypothetical protein PHMEG_00015742 [Phytophthora megakarya]|uniref:Cyclic nucleotide-binding domain-containing protein n=1 Tax=Phytophthora megakarya TaxID=4795 RepID=A0A225W0N6_9STRA|nr:hypothetical protein PHMEG_00015742 [Phytophthora megakarya]